ncbi:MAG: archaetidylserine decarboxylase [Gammaproteobacteria bacterium]
MLRLLKILPQYLLPQHTLSACMYRLARLRYPPLKDRMIRAFIRLYNVDMSEADETDSTEFADFNSFFTRELKPDARPLDNSADALLSPVDGRVSQSGHIREGCLLQAKGIKYSALELLGNDPDAALRFSKGAFMTLYLAPRDYHRVHMPVAGTLEKMAYVPGKLFSVNPVTTENVSRLFARNERVISLFNTFHGRMAVIMVGAIFVGSMETVWAGQVTPARDRSPGAWTYDHLQDPVTLDKGEEMGRFNMGSTVILLFEKDRVQWLETLKPGERVKMGEKIGIFV